MLENGAMWIADLQHHHVDFMVHAACSCSLLHFEGLETFITMLTLWFMLHAQVPPLLHFEGLETFMFQA